MPETFVRLKNGGNLNSRYIRRYGYSMGGNYFAIDDQGFTWDLDEEPGDLGCVFVSGSGVAHCFWDSAPRDTEPTLDCITRTTTSVVAWRIRLNEPYWPTPILMDSTDPDGRGSLLVVVEDQGKYQEIGLATFDTLDQAQEEALEMAKRDRARERQNTEKKEGHRGSVITHPAHAAESRCDI